MNKLHKENINHFMEAGAFLLISAIVIWTVALITPKAEIEHERRTETQQIEFTDASKEVNPDIPEEVLGEAVRIAKAELEYIWESRLLKKAATFGLVAFPLPFWPQPERTAHDKILCVAPLCHHLKE